MVGQRNKKTCLAVGGLDPSGGAGIIADVRAFLSFGCHPMTVLTSVTYQNDDRVFGLSNQTPESVQRQLAAVFGNGEVHAIKTGMIRTAAIVDSVADALVIHGHRNFVVDPVLRSSSGFDLIDADAFEALSKRLFPLASLVTPNVYEAERLSGILIENERDIERAAKRLHSIGAKKILIKGGHFEPNSEISQDFLFADGERTVFDAQRVPNAECRGTGCMLASAIAANLALGNDLEVAIKAAKDFVRDIIQASAAALTHNAPSN
jgi:hydroxymethylpyrimidine kinase/phosphomethylpyrimidine kinase